MWRHVGKFSVNAADSLPKSKPVGDRRRDEEVNPSPHIPAPLMLLHRQIRARGKIEGFVCLCVGYIDEESLGV